MSKKVVAIAAVLLSTAASAFAATPITLTPYAPNKWSASFASSTSGANVYTLDLTGLSGFTNIDFLSQVTANFTGGSGYDVATVTFDGLPYGDIGVSIPGLVGTDILALSLPNLSPTVHTIVVTGSLVGGSVGFTGSVGITAQPVPEPESYALMLAGLAAIGAVVRRRSTGR